MVYLLFGDGISLTQRYLKHIAFSFLFLGLSTCSLLLFLAALGVSKGGWVLRVDPLKTTFRLLTAQSQQGIGPFLYLFHFWLLLKSYVLLTASRI